MSDNITPGSQSTAVDRQGAIAPPPVPAGGTPPQSASSGLSTAALIVGIVAVVSAAIPFLSFVAFVPALVAIVLGIAALVRKTPRRGRGISGLVLGTVAFVLAIVVSVGVVSAMGEAATKMPPAAIAGGSSTSPTATSPEPAESAATEDAKAVEATAEDEAIEEENEPAPVAVPADVKYEGSGDSIQKIELPDGADSIGVLTMNHQGTRNFAVWSLDANMERQDLLVNTIGGYKGTVLFDVRDADHTTALEITADGSWTATLHSLKAIRAFDDTTVSGNGDDVILYGGAAGAATITHDGERNFAIWQYGSDTDLVVNKIGAYNGQVRWSAGPAVIAITADGEWNITVE